MDTTKLVAAIEKYQVIQAGLEELHDGAKRAWEDVKAKRARLMTCAPEDLESARAQFLAAEAAHATYAEKGAKVRQVCADAALAMNEEYRALTLTGSVQHVYFV